MDFSFRGFCFHGGRSFTLGGWSLTEYRVSPLLSCHHRLRRRPRNLPFSTEGTGGPIGTIGPSQRQNRCLFGKQKGASTGAHRNKNTGRNKFLLSTDPLRRVIEIRYCNKCTRLTKRWHVISHIYQYIVSFSSQFSSSHYNKNSSGDEIANVNFYAVRPEATRIRWNNAK